MKQQAFQQTLVLPYVQFLIYRQNSVLYLPAGQYKRVNCNQQYMGVWGINLAGEEIPVPTTTVPPASGGTTTQFQSATVLIPTGRVWVDTAYFGDANFKVVVKVKDMQTGDVFYIDAANFATNILKCNAVGAVTSCPNASNLVVSGITTTGATVTFTLPGGPAGIEWVNSTSGTTPAGHGTLLPAPGNSVAVTGLTTGTLYHFFARTLCAGGVEGAWVSVSYTTS